MVTNSEDENHFTKDKHKNVIRAGNVPSNTIDDTTTSAILSDELVAIRGRHEEEKRQLINTNNELRRRNEELELHCLQLQRLASSSNISAGANKNQTHIDDEEEISFPATSRDDDEDGDTSKLIAALREQLRQAEHKASVLSDRLHIVKESGESVIQSLNEELADVAEDRARVESALMKELSEVDTKRRSERNEYQKRIEEWISHDANMKMEVENYQLRIESLLETISLMGVSSDDTDNITTTSSSWEDEKAQQDIMLKDLTNYIDLLGGNTKNSKRNRSLLMTINDEFDLLNADPNTADDMLRYYRARPEMKDFTIKSELPRMDYEVLTIDKTGKDVKLIATDEIRTYFASLESKPGGLDEEVDIILRAANQSILADPLSMLTTEGGLVHSGSFHSTVIATECKFKLDLRREGERRVRVDCQLAISVPSGLDGGCSNTKEPFGGEEKEMSSATLELARANLVIQFSPSPFATPSGPLAKYELLSIIPTIADYEEGTDNAKALDLAASALAKHTHIQCSGDGENTDVVADDTTRSNVKDRFLSRVVKQFTSSTLE